MPYQPERHGPRRIVGPGFHEQVFAVVKRVPAGRVTTYGDIGAALGLKTIARQVGYALAALADRDDVPWHRVVNGRGEISRRSSGDGADQRSLLQADGVEVDARGRIVEFAARRYSPRPRRGAG